MSKLGEGVLLSLPFYIIHAEFLPPPSHFLILFFVDFSVLTLQEQYKVQYLGLYNHIVTYSCSPQL